MIRAISLDLDDTLWPISPLIERAEAALHAYLDRHCPRTAAAYPVPRMRALREQVAREHPQLAHDFTQQRLICLARALAESGEDAHHAQAAFEALYRERNRVVFYADTLSALDALGARFPLAALTNGNADLERIGIRSRFAVVVAAREMGVAKPERTIFEHTARQLGVALDEVLHVGDDPYLDVEGAARSGMRTCWVNRGAAAWPTDLPRPDLEVASLGMLVTAHAHRSTRARHFNRPTRHSDKAAMLLPSCFIPTDTPTLPLYLVDAARFPAWKDAQTPPVRAWIEAHAFCGDALTHLVIPGADGAPTAAVAGIGDPQDPASLSHLPVLLPALAFRIAADSPVAVATDRALIGWGLGAYKFARYLKSVKPTAKLAIDAEAQAEALAVLGASCHARDLINTPTEHMGPDELEADVQALAAAHGAAFRCVRGPELLAQNFPAIHAVGRASHRAPRLIELSHGDLALPQLVIVGKGVCFDTGGLDVKPPEGMRHMKKDMGGAAHAIALARLVLERALPVRLTLLVPAVENALGPDAYRPGEVIATRAGVSVEIDNTDAEGRVILGDALTYAAELKPALIMDFATLTGAARIALGPDLPALFCNRDELANAYLDAGVAERDPLWRMPLWRPYQSYLKSGIADMANAGASRMAGCVTAALYLERFLPDAQPWTHVDVYSWNDTDRPGKPAGGEAQGLRAAWSFLKRQFQTIQFQTTR